MQKIDTIEQFKQLLRSENTFFVLKHSLTCPISQAAYDDYGKFTKDHEDVSSYYVIVQEARPLSNYIADTFNVKHESPQALLFFDKQVEWDASHWNITKDQLNEAYNGVK